LLAHIAADPRRFLIRRARLQRGVEAGGHVGRIGRWITLEPRKLDLGLIEDGPMAQV
jgi:hypothetical protein